MTVGKRVLNRLLVAVVVVATTVGSARAPVKIAKCCKYDEFLMSDSECHRNESASWNVHVWNGRDLIFEKHQGTLPKFWRVTEAARPNCTNPKYISLSERSSFPFLNGSLFIVEYDLFIRPSAYCLDYYAALVCFESPEHLTKVSVKKCCGKNAILSVNDTCRSFRDKNDTYRLEIGEGFTQTEGFPVCEDNSFHVVGELERSELFPNGSLLTEKDAMLAPGNFCLEFTLGHNVHSASVITCPIYGKGEPTTTRTRVETDLRHTIYPIGLALSAIFLAATLAAGSLLPASHHVLHWRCQTNHVACLLLGDVLLCITNLSGKIPYVPCFAIAVSMHFLFISAFFWLNTMCFNIWWTFRDLRPQSTEKSQERLRLRFYEAYAWFIPSVIALVAMSLDLSRNDEYEMVRPKFAEHNCWFHGDISKLTFFYGPIGTLLFINLVLFALTARELTCGLWKRELVKSTTERAALGKVCLKLVVVMGVSWILDVISWAVGGPHEIWYVTDFINSIHGIFIFIVVGCQPQVLSAVKRFWCLRKHRQNGTAGTTHHHSTSSQGPPSLGDTLTNTTCVIANGNNVKSPPLETTC